MNTPTPETDAAIAELNQRLIDRQVSFQTQLVKIEGGWREKLKESQSQIVALREAVQPFLSVVFVDPQDRPLARAANEIGELLDSTPPPPCVPLEDAKALLNTLQIVLKSAMPHATANPAMHTDWNTANSSVHLFLAKHPLPAKS